MPSHPLAFFGAVMMFSGLMAQVIFMDPAATLPKLAFALMWIMIGCTMFVSGVLLGIAEGRHTHRSIGPRTSRGLRKGEVGVRVGAPIRPRASPTRIRNGATHLNSIGRSASQEHVRRLGGPADNFGPACARVPGTIATAAMYPRLE